MGPKLNIEELTTCTPSSNIIRVIKSRRIIREEHVTRMGERRHAYSFFVEKAEGKSPLGRTRRRRENNIKMYFQEVAWGMYLLTWVRRGTNGGLLRIL